MANPQRTILLVDNNPDDCTEIQRALEHDLVATYTCVTADSAAAARALCQGGLPDAIVLNAHLPDSDGLALIAGLAAAHGEHACAIILLLDAKSEPLAARALEHGAHDYVLKGPALAHSVGRAVASAITQVQLRRELAAAQSATLLGRASGIDAQKQAEIRIRAQSARLQVLADASHAFAAAGTDYPSVLALFARIAAEQLGAGTIIRMRSDDGQWLDTVAFYDRDPAAHAIVQALFAHSRIHVDDPNPITTVVRSGQPLFTPHIDPAALALDLWPAFERIRPHSGLITPLVVQGASIGCISLLRHERDQPAFTEDELTLAQDVADRAALAISNARLFRDLQHELGERRRAQVALDAERAQLQRLYDITAALARTRTCDQVLHAMIDACDAMFGAWSSVAVVADRAGDLLKLSQVRGNSAATPPAVEHVPLDTPLPLADAIRQQKLLWIESRAASLARYPQLSQHVSSDDDFALICVPFVLDDRALGSLALQIVPPRPASVAEVAFLEAVAYQCAQALDRALLYDAIRASRQQLMELSVRLVNAQEDQRRTLAYELHDEIGQQLTGLNMVLESGMRVTAAQPSAQLSDAQRLVADLIGQVRQLSLDLRPPMLDDMGLLATLLWHIQRYTQRTNVIVDFKYHELDAELPPHVAITAYRIVQEGLTNIARHAQTATAVVRVWVSAGQLKISIEDQGCGFDVATTPLVGRSVGLMGMHERTQLLGGQFSLDSRPGEGTHIRVTLPIDTAKGL